MTPLIRVGLLFIVFLSLTSCAGYRVGNVSGRNLQGVHSVFVPTVHNQSLAPSIEAITTDAIIRRFNDDGTLSTEQDANADSELDVQITNVQLSPIRSTTSDVYVTAQYEATMTASATYINRRLGKKIFDNQVFIGTTRFYLQNDLVEGERQALPLAAEDLAKNIVRQVTEGW